MNPLTIILITVLSFSWTKENVSTMTEKTTRAISEEQLNPVVLIHDNSVVASQNDSNIRNSTRLEIVSNRSGELIPGYAITWFEYVYSAGKQDPIVRTNLSENFNRELKAIIESSVPGDQIIFRKIKAINPEGTMININSKVVSVQ